MTRLRGTLVAFAAIVCLAVSAFGADIDRKDLLILGLSLEVDTTTVVANSGIPAAVQTKFGGKINDDAPPDNGMTAVGELTGPGIDTPIRLVTKPGHLFQLPLLYEKGDYVLRNIRLVSADGKTLQTAVPSFANITITQILTTKLSVHQLTPDELRARGITVDANNYDVYEYTFIFAINGQTVSVPYPVIIDKRTHEVVKAPSVDPYSLPSLPQHQSPPRFQPPIVHWFPLDKPEPGGGGMPPPGEHEPHRESISIPAGLVVPTGFGVLHQFFAVILNVGNSAPEGSAVTIDSISATLDAPLGLRLAKTTPAVSIGQAVPVVDETTGARFLVATAQGSAEWSLEALKTGTHTVTVQVRATYKAPNQPDTPLKGNLSASFVVSDPRFQVNFVHPDTVRSGEEYTAYAFITNTSATAQTVRIDPGQIPVCSGESSWSKFNVCFPQPMDPVEGDDRARQNAHRAVPPEVAAYGQHLRGRGHRGREHQSRCLVDDGGQRERDSALAGDAADAVVHALPRSRLRRRADVALRPRLQPGHRAAERAHGAAAARDSERRLPPRAGRSPRRRAHLHPPRRSERPASRSTIASRSSISASTSSATSSAPKPPIHARLEGVGRAASLRGQRAKCSRGDDAAARARRADRGQERRRLHERLCSDDGASFAVPPRHRARRTCQRGSPAVRDDAHRRHVAIEARGAGRGGCSLDAHDAICRADAVPCRQRVCRAGDDRPVQRERADRRRPGIGRFRSRADLSRGDRRLDDARVVSRDEREPLGCLIPHRPRYDKHHRDRWSVRPGQRTIGSRLPATLAIAGAAQDLHLNGEGRTVSLLFNRPIDVADTSTIRDLIALTTDVAAIGYHARRRNDGSRIYIPGAALQADGRILDVYFDKTLSKNAAYTIALDDSLLPGAPAGSGSVHPRIDNDAPAGLLYGKVLRADNTPVANAPVTLLVKDIQQLDLALDGSVTGNASDTGRYLFEYIPRDLDNGAFGTFRAGTSGAGGTVQSDGIIRAPGEMKELNLVFIGRGTASGFVSYSDGRPLARATVVAGRSGYNDPLQTEMKSAISGADGSFSISDLPVGPFTLSVSDDAGNVCFAANQIHFPGEALRQDLVIRLKPFPGTGTVRITVRRSDISASDPHSLVAGAHVGVFTEGYGLVDGNTDANGRAEFTKVPAGTISILAANFGITMASAGVEVDLHPDAVIDQTLTLDAERGRILHRARRSSARSSATIRSIRPVSRRSPVRRSRSTASRPVTAGADGKFTYEGIPLALAEEGDRLGIRSPSGRLRKLLAADCAHCWIANAFNITLSATKPPGKGTIRVRLFDAAGQLVTNYQVLSTGFPIIDFPEAPANPGIYELSNLDVPLTLDILAVPHGIDSRYGDQTAATRVHLDFPGQIITIDLRLPGQGNVIAHLGCAPGVTECNLDVHAPVIITTESSILTRRT